MRTPWLKRHPVDQVSPLAQLARLSLQHVPVISAGAVAVPLAAAGARVLTKVDFAEHSHDPFVVVEAVSVGRNAAFNAIGGSKEAVAEATDHA